MTIRSSELQADHRAPSSGYPVLLFNIAPGISTMLTYALHLSGYTPVELTDSMRALQWVRTASRHDLSPRAAVFDMGTPADHGFLRQVRTCPALLMVGFAAYGRGTPGNRHIWEEWVDIILPKPFRVRELLAMLHEHGMAPAGPTFCP